MAEFAQRLQADGHKVKLLNGDYYNFIDSDRIRDFYEDKNFDKWFNFSEEYEQLYEEDYDVDWEYLRNFESKHCENKNFQQLLMSDQVLARHHHHRDPYYTPIKSEAQRYYWAQLQIQWLEGIIKEFNPDLLFTLKRSYFIKNVAAQIAMSSGIPMLTLIRSRLGENCHMVENFGYGTSDRAEKYIKSEFSDSETEEARNRIESFRAENSPSLYESVSQQRIADGDLYSTSDVLQFLAERTFKIGSKIILRKKHKYRQGFIKGNYFNSHFPRVLYHYGRVSYNRLKYIYRNPFQQTLPDRPFIYFPLHTLPESSTLTLSTEYFEGDLIRHLSKESPAGMEIAVKENPNMVGVRPFEFYDKMKAIPNVRLLDPTISSKRLILGSQGVSGISGTALLEAAMLDKITLAFGHPEFESVLTYSGHNDVESFLQDCDAGKKDDSDDVVNYIKFLLDNGAQIPLREMRTEPDSPEFETGIDTLYELFQAEIDRLGYS